MRRLHATLVGIAACAVAGPVLIVTHAPRIKQEPFAATRPHVVPKAEVPPVEPVKFVTLAPETARAFNAAIPFSLLPNPSAKAFHLTGDPKDQARAVDCMAAAVLYEAGDDAVGEHAVAQVVLNRLRHPAFPKTVCGVVFEGAGRSTGCQFTFACDGALARLPTEAAWARARGIAAAALAGAVYKEVGYATHYHTDWVVPYWQASLDKVAAVHTHLFFRWSGWWGTPAAFHRDVETVEPIIAKLAALSPAHRPDTPLGGIGIALAGGPERSGIASAPMATDQNSFLVTLDRGTAPDLYPVLAARACGDRAYCKYMAWADRKSTPSALPLGPAEIAAMAFSYLRNRANGYDKALWNCQQAKRLSPSQCMKIQVLGPPAANVVAPRPAALPQVAELGGVRRKVSTATPNGTGGASVPLVTPQ